jgi:hypothetical protein
MAREEWTSKGVYQDGELSRGYTIIKEFLVPFLADSSTSIRSEVDIGAI